MFQYLALRLSFISLMLLFVRVMTKYDLDLFVLHVCPLLIGLFVLVEMPLYVSRVDTPFSSIFCSVLSI